jgi:DNA-binding MarR family transcriptional regulator
MPNEKNITEAEKTLGALLRTPYQKLQSRIYRQLAETGFADIRPAHSSVFRHILPSGSRVTELADRADMTKQSMAYLVNYLHEHGYVRLTPDPQDGRAKIVHLTERGIAFQEAAITLSRRAESDIANQLGAREMDKLRQLLDRMAHELDR